MKSRITIFGHPVHQTLIPLPVGLLVSGVLFDLAYFATDRPFFATVSFWNIFAGVIFGAIAAIFGLIDAVTVTSGRAKDMAFTHGLTMAVVVGAFSLATALRWGTWLPTAGSMLLEVIALVIAAVGAWLGGDLVLRYGIGTYEHASQVPRAQVVTPAVAERFDGGQAFAGTRCQDVARANVETVHEDDSIADAVAKMRTGNLGFLPVVETSGRVIGTLTDRDVALRACEQDRSPSRVRVGEIMTREVIACSPSDDLRRAQDLMETFQKSRVMLVDRDGILVGVVSLSDVASVDDTERSARTLRRVTEREARI